MQFIRSVNELATECRWKAKSFLKKWKKGEEVKEKFGFKSTKLAPRVDHCHHLTVINGAAAAAGGL